MIKTLIEFNETKNEKKKKTFKLVEKFDQI